jgi:D-alanine-D-alanine ligase
VKPNKNGSSYGAAKVDNQNGLMDALNNAFNYDNEVIVEEFLKGREVTNGVFTHNGIIQALPITEIRSKNDFFDYKAKYEGDSQEITPAEIDAVLTKSIQETSVFIYKQLEFKGMCRIDYIITENGYYMLEVNSIPGISAESIVPQQAKAMGFSLPEFFGMSIEDCLRK